MLSMQLSEGGRVVIPVEIRRALELKQGDTVLWDFVDGQALLTTRKAQLAAARKLFQRHCPPSADNNTDAFLAERRQEDAAA